MALPVANNRPGNHILDEVFVRSFFIEENNSYEDLLEVIKNRYPNLSRWLYSSLLSVKGFSVVMVSRREGQLRMEQSIAGQCKIRIADWGKMQTEGKNGDCRPGVKCRL